MLIQEFSNGVNSQFAKLIGVNESNIRSYLAGTQPKFDVLSAIAGKLAINCEWLLTGKGKVEDQHKKARPSGELDAKRPERVCFIITFQRSTHMLASIFSLNVIQTALELGCIYALVALALFLSYSILNIADLSTDGCFTLGCAVACQVALTGHPILALAAAMAAGVCSGFVTAFLQTRLGVESIMAGIIVNTGLYTINLAAMGFSSTMSLVKTETIFSLAKKSLGFLGSWYKLVLVGVIIALACAAMLGFLGTRLGLSIRATGDNTAMVRASSINPAFTITVGLCVSGALCALSGGLLAQYQKSCDINVGTGMVTIALASLIIGETLVGKRTMLRRILGVVFGSCLYRFIVAVALRFNVPAAAMKLVSAIIVAVAISMPAIREHFAFEKRKHAARARCAAAVKEGK
mgnify:CR=1 FL=1